MTARFPILGMVGLAAIAAFQLTLGASDASTIPQEASGAPRSVWDGIYTDEQAKRGEAVYGEFCGNCHGPAMNGGEMAGPLTGPIFTSNWNGVTVADLFDRIRVTMPLDRPGVLTRQQNADVLAFMFSANKMPAGKTELQNRSEMLKGIQFRRRSRGHNPRGARTVRCSGRPKRVLRAGPMFLRRNSSVTRSSGTSALPVRPVTSGDAPAMLVRSW